MDNINNNEKSKNKYVKIIGDDYNDKRKPILKGCKNEICYCTGACYKIIGYEDNKEFNFKTVIPDIYANNLDDIKEKYFIKLMLDLYKNHNDLIKEILNFDEIVIDSNLSFEKNCEINNITDKREFYKKILDAKKNEFRYDKFKYLEINIKI